MEFEPTVIKIIMEKFQRRSQRSSRYTVHTITYYKALPSFQKVQKYRDMLSVAELGVELADRRGETLGSLCGWDIC